MLKKPIFIEMFVLLAITGILNQIAVAYNLYWSMAEFDSAVHFFGGAAVSAFFIWLYFFSGFFQPSQRNLKNFLIVSVLGTMFISVSWEVFELILGEAKMQGVGYAFDTAMDLTMDFFGSITICFYGYLREHILSEKRKIIVEQDLEKI